MNNEYFLHVIGSGDAFHSGGKLHTSFLYKTPQHHFLIDCGATTLLGLQNQNAEIENIDTVIITHLHGDHFAGLPFLLLYMLKVQKRTKPLSIILPNTGKDKLKTLFEIMYPGTENTLDHLPLNFMPLQRNIMLDPFTIEANQVKHTQKLDCFGISISDKNKKVAYSGDTEWTHSLISLSDKADLFICECNFYDEPIEGHMNYIDLMNNEKFLSCKKVMLTHLGFKMLHKNLRHEYLYDGQIYHL